MSQDPVIIPGVTMSYPVFRVNGTDGVETRVEVCTESRVILLLNETIIGDLSITPMNLEEFALGYLICEGYITSPDQVSRISVSLPDIRITCPDLRSNSLSGRFSKNSSGGSCRDLLPECDILPLPDGLVIESRMILSSMEKVNDYSVIWKRTGGMHCSLIIREDGQILCGVEDMGRHTTIDKAVGMAIRQGADLSRCFLVCSGRLPVDMVAKAYRAGIP